MTSTERILCAVGKRIEKFERELFKVRANLSWGVASKCNVSRTDVKKLANEPTFRSLHDAIIKVNVRIINSASINNCN